ALLLPVLATGLIERSWLRHGNARCTVLPTEPGFGGSSFRDERRSGRVQPRAGIGCRADRCGRHRPGAVTGSSGFRPCSSAAGALQNASGPIDAVPTPSAGCALLLFP